MDSSGIFYSVFMRSISAYGINAYVEWFRSPYKCEAEATYNTALMLIGATDSRIYGAKLTVTTNGVTHILQEHEGDPPAIRIKPVGGEYYERRRPMRYAGYRR